MNFAPQPYPLFAALAVEGRGWEAGRVLGWIHGGTGVMVANIGGVPAGSDLYFFDSQEEADEFASDGNNIPALKVA